MFTFLGTVDLLFMLSIKGNRAIEDALAKVIINPKLKAAKQEAQTI